MIVTVALEQEKREQQNIGDSHMFIFFRSLQKKLQILETFPYIS